MFIPPLYHWPKKSLWMSSAIPSGKTWNDFSAYFHYPFCRHLCDFCGYETRDLARGRDEEVSQGILRDLRRSLDLDKFQNSKVESVFFGGGTASLMPPELVEECLHELSNKFDSTRLAEVTLECEPGTISPAKLRRLKDAGVNRISVCAQSDSDEILQLLGRKHKHQHSMKLIESAISAGIHNIHVDLMYNIPGQTVENWISTVSSISTLPVYHISTYKLYVFKYGALNRRGFHRGDEERQTETDIAREMYDASCDILSRAGFIQYTLTEFARVGHESKYIQRCFDGGEILALGPGACGRNGNYLWENTPYLSEYGSSDFFKGRIFFLNRAEEVKRDIILGLWLLKVDLDEVAEKHRVQLSAELVSFLDEIRGLGLVEFDGTVLSLNREQRFDSGSCMARLNELPAVKWIVLPPDSIRSGSDYGPPTAQQGLSKLGQVAKIARRDRELFDMLRIDPDKTLAGLGYDLNDRHIRFFCNVIRNEALFSLDRDLEGVGDLWTSIQREYL